MTHFLRISLMAIAIFLQACSTDLPEEVAVAYEDLPDELDYNLHVKPILSDKCFACHGPDKGKRKAGLRLDIPDAAFASLPEHPRKVAIDPGDPDGSELFFRILSTDPEYRMPLPESNLSLTAHEKAVLIKWIQDGAEYKPHWAFVKPERPDVPESPGASQLVNPIDHFIIEKLQQEDLQASPRGDKELLLRRLSLDMTGLPPTLEEIDSYVNDTSDNAWEKQVDRLLNSPHYGEKMAVHWLDLARFADSHGYTVDRLRDMSPYRDWVIDAFNRNLPYDKFVHEQLAGDLMPDPSTGMIVATAFNRNHPQNMEGGIVEREFQTEYVVDRTNTFGDAFLGLSLQCARCHDHKFDPVTQKNYFEIYSFFNNVKEAGQISWNDAMPGPTVLLPTELQEDHIEKIKTAIAGMEDQATRAQNEGKRDVQDWLDANAYKSLMHEVIPRKGLIAFYSFDDGSLKNRVNLRQAGTMKQLSGEEKPSFVKRNDGKALTLNGDTWLDLEPVGVFRKSEPFSIGLWVNIPGDLSEGVIFHKSIAERLYNFRGYHLYLKDNKLELNLAHTAPSNAITLLSTESIPRDRWIQLTVTYNGSSKASGLRLFLDGAPMEMEVVMDQLTKDILFRTGKEPGLQLGAWDRGYGLKGASVDEVAVYDRVLTPFEVKILAGQGSWSTLLSQEKGELSAEALHALEQYYHTCVNPDKVRAGKELMRLRTALADSMESVRELMVMQEMSVPKKTYLLERGNYDSPGEQVFPNTPSFVLPFPEDLPRNRLGLAQWLTHRDNPLTARVAVNRLWQNFFGTGLVKTSENFGNQGEYPSHPELLDWLAVEFRESGWDIKRMNKLIVMSATYQQSSETTAGLREKDPENRLLARGPAHRLTAEMIRDNALAASGLLNKNIGGESVKPYQPEGLWEINNARYKPDSGPAVYRRSLYVLVKRSVPNPTLATFDATSRTYCVARRQVTNTPLQALVTLNDPTFIEAARALGAQMASIGDEAKAIVSAYRKLTGRTPAEKEVGLLGDLLEYQLKRFKANPGKARGWLNTGQYRISDDVDPLLTAACAVVASTIMNSDATLTKR